MKNAMGKRLISLLVSAMLVISMIPTYAFAATPAEAASEATDGTFVLVVESNGALVIAPEYVGYKNSQTIREALMESGHNFLGIEDGIVAEVDGVGGNFTRSDEDGEFDLNKMAYDIEFYRFSEDEDLDSTPSEGLRLLMTAMADYKLKAADVQQAAKEAYDTAYEQFVGLDSASARFLAEQLMQAMSDYETVQNGTKYTLTFSNGTTTHTGVSIQVENEYGKHWTDDGDGILSVPAGNYTFQMERDGLHVQGDITVSGNLTVTAKFPQQNWLKLDSFRLSGSYGAEDNEENKFTDGEFTMGTWNNRQVTVPVADTFTGTVYSYVEYDTAQLSEVPSLKAIYHKAGNGKDAEQDIPFQSLTSGAIGALKKGAEGNSITYRVTSEGTDGYLYAQDYVVTFERIPTLSAISVTDQNGISQVATTVFDGNAYAYTYKVLDSVTSVTVAGTPLIEGYDVQVDGKDATNGVTVDIAGVETTFDVKVSAGGYSTTYTLTICPGAGKSLSFITQSTDVTLEVVNANDEVIPYEKFREGTKNRYKYTLVPGETYSYVATRGTYYHIKDEFTMEDVADSTITVDVPTEDWLTGLAFGNKSSGTYKGKLELDSAFSAADHQYEVQYVDTEHNAYVWVTGASDVTIKAIYNQIYASSLYHGKERTVSLTSGKATGAQLNRFLMDENPYENTVTVRLSKDVDGVTHYQDYLVAFKRQLTLEKINCVCDGVTATLLQKDGTTGFKNTVNEYDIKVSMAASSLEIDLTRYMDNMCYGEESVGYRILVDGADVTDEGKASIELDGTIETQVVQITVENDKAPEGTTTYIVNVLKSPPVEVNFDTTPGNTILSFRETMSGERIWPGAGGTYQLCEGYSYQYALTKYGYVGKTGTLSVTRDAENRLVITDGDAAYTVTESENGGGTATIVWSLAEADVNSKLDPTIPSEWPNFRGNNENNSVTDAAVPIAAEEGTLYWANQIGEGFDSNAVGSPIIVDGDLITYAGNTIYRVDAVTGEILLTGTMDHKSSFAITPPTYYEGMVFVALSNGTVQAFNAETLESLWIYKDPLGGQPNCPLTVHDGYLYTGFWNSETGDANFICISVTDEDPADAEESKCASWFYTKKGGFYWAGAYVTDEYLLVGTDDGTNSGKSQSSSLLLLDNETGKLLDSWDNLNGDIRSTIVYDAATDAHYFTSKGGSFYSVQVAETENGLKITNQWDVTLSNGSGNSAMSTSSPSVYNGRAYIGVAGIGQFAAYSGHNISVIDLGSKKIAYSVETQGYPQTSGLLTTAYEKTNGYTYVYFFDNMTPGKLRVLRDKPGQTSPNYLTTENGRETAYALFTPTGDQAQYAICSPIVDEYGTVYFKNDSAHLMAFGSAMEKIEVTKKPDKMTYQEGEIFDPAGMVVTATYANGNTRDITKYVKYSTDPITADHTEIVISFEHLMYHNGENGSAMDAGIKSTTPVTTLTVMIGNDSTGDGDDTTGGDDEHASGNHVWDDGTVINTPTCEAEGTMLYTCVCGKTKMESIPANGHTEVIDEAVAAGCLTEGKTEGIHCSVCNTIIEAQKSTPAKGHMEMTVSGKRATCTEPGLTDGKKCSECGLIMAEQEVIPAKGHTEKTEMTPAKTTAAGEIVTSCEVCEKILDTETIASIKTVKLSYSKKNYTGKYITAPTLTVKDSEGNSLIKDTDYTVTGLKNKKEVGRYKVTVNFMGKYTGKKTLYFTIVPKAPSKVTAELYGYDDVKVTWSKAAGASGYTVYYKKSGAKDYALLTDTAKTYVNKSNLSDGKKYYFKVVPYYESGSTKYTSLSSKTDNVYTLKQVSQPTLSKSGTKVKVKWTNINGETGYQISKSTKKSGTNIVETYKTSKGDSKLVSATKGKTYYYKVRAYKKVTIDGKTKTIYGPWSAAKAYKRR